MTEDDKSFLKEFLTRSGIIGVIVGLFILFIAFTIKHNPPELKPSAEVVDTYENCDIIRWSTNQMAEYKYFLKCNE